ncbi:MAG TPA: LysE family translocator [Thermoflexales bacterium]|jgi:threonine/homoserine/homoserine lactone efflux protein|nr:LysE family translocator [Thermoflexales bacterium]HQY25874.1 LysE family translocator [Thermoflexales bacterium]HQZ54597.1 LysE family translocator [Thermoflexales bacterium]HRA54655.1 LysE family translocator [Thermoflexales bacterium]
MDPLLFLRALALGFSIAAPVGPIGALCIRRTLTQGRLAGFVTGLGAATADALYGAIAAFGLTALTTALVGISFWTRLIGGVFLIYLGVRTLVARPAADEAAPESRRSLLGAYASSVALTLTNPATIISFLGVFAGLGIGAASGWAGALIIVAGVFAGSLAWWMLLTVVLGGVRHRLSPGVMRAINIASGLLIVGFGLAALISLIAG